MRILVGVVVVGCGLVVVTVIGVWWMLRAALLDRDESVSQQWRDAHSRHHEEPL